MTAGVITAVVLAFVSLIIIRKFKERTWGKCRNEIEMKNKVVVITGANSGIGKATAEELAKRGACVIMACRDMKKAQTAADDIRKRTRNGVLKPLELDLASFDSIRTFAESVLKAEGRLDVLINNAGVFECPFTMTKDGYEMQFGVNHLGHFYLTKLLLDKIKQTTPSRIVNVSSLLYKRGSINIDTINSDSHYDKRKAYCNSKLANILFTCELAKRLVGTAVSVYAVSPGMVWTNLGRHVRLPWWKIALLFPFGFVLIRTPYQGCQTVLHCAISADVKKETGLYYSNCAPCELEIIAKDDDLAKILWDYSEKCVASH